MEVPIRLPSGSEDLETSKDQPIPTRHLWRHRILENGDDYTECSRRVHHQINELTSQASNQDAISSNDGDPIVLSVIRKI